MIAKIKPLQELLEILSDKRREENKIVFTNGCFDLLHIGHIRYLQDARELGDLLVVGVNSDASIRTLNKDPRRPIVPEDQRTEVLAALGCVDFVVVFHESDPLVLIESLRPDVLVKGGDWTPERIIGRKEVEAQGGSVHSIPLTPGISTTLLIQRIVKLQTTSPNAPYFPETKQGNDLPSVSSNDS